MVAFELDPCLVRTGTGELLVRGFVREHGADSLLIEAEHFTGRWLEPGDLAVVEVMSAHRGACTYDAVVVFSEARRIELAGLRLRTVVQQRAAVRVLTAIPLQVTHRVEETEQVPLDEPMDIVVLDVSASGMRFRCDTELAAGARVALTFPPTRMPLELVLEVLRIEEHKVGRVYGCALVGITERESDELFRFALDEQRRQLAQRSGAR